MTKRKKEPGLVIGLDYGGSTTKGAGITAEGRQQLSCLEPHVQRVPKESLITGDLLGERAAEDRAWVGVGDEYYAIGYLAKERFQGIAKLSLPKYFEAVQKTLAVVWILSKKLNKGRKLRIALGCLLPPGEYADKHLFEEELRAALSRFETPDGIMSVSLATFDCKPEGGGVFLMHRYKRGVELKQRCVGIGVIGYRNASVMIAQRGAVSQLQTSSLGMVKLVTAVRERVGSVAVGNLAGAIVAAGIEVNRQALRQVIFTREAVRVNQELDRLTAAIELAIEEYWLQLSNWWSEVLPQQLQEMVWTGGTVDYLQSKINPVQFENWSFGSK